MHIDITGSRPISGRAARLIAEGHPPETPVVWTRGGVPLFDRVRSLEWWASVEVNGNGRIVRRKRCPTGGKPAVGAESAFGGHTLATPLKADAEAKSPVAAASAEPLTTRTRPAATRQGRYEAHSLVPAGGGNERTVAAPERGLRRAARRAARRSD